MPTPRVTIDDLPAVTTVSGGQLVVIQDTGVTKKVTVDDIAAYISDNSTVVTDTVWVGVGEPDDDEIELWYDTDAAGAGGSSITGPTVDTGETYRMIMFSNGDVRAIPVDVVAPDIPTGLTETPRINSVRLTWAVPLGATSYAVYRNGSPYATATTNFYRDRAVTVGETYTYAVQSVNAYGLRSAVTATVSAFIDPALNVTPTVEIRTWPNSIALGNRAIIRVNATDVDGQVLANLLSTDVGTLVATADPTVWMLEPV